METTEETPKKKGRPDWVSGMKSPNPKGRPKGIEDRRTRIRQQLEADAPAVAQTIVKLALAGDVQACGLVPNRVVSPLKNQTERVSLDFDANKPIVEQCEAVLAAVAAGQVPPDTAREIIKTIASVQAIKQITEIEARLVELEKKS